MTLFDSPYQLLADLVLVLHAAVVAFVAGGLLLIIFGNFKGWRWVNGLAFRCAHLGAISVVAAQAWLGVACPLTILEMRLREMAALPTYTEGFVQHWLQRALYHDAPAWVFLAGYSLFGLIVMACWWYFPPFHRRGGADAA